MTHLVDERGYGALLKQQEQNGVQRSATAVCPTAAPTGYGDKGHVDEPETAEGHQSLPDRQPLFPHAGGQYQDGAGAAPVPVLGDGTQPVVEGAAPER